MQLRRVGSIIVEHGVDTKRLCKLFEDQGYHVLIENNTMCNTVKVLEEVKHDTWSSFQ